MGMYFFDFNHVTQKIPIMNIQRNIYVEKVDSLPIEAQPVELVERKGIGHPDSICDAIMEATSVTLCREYQERFGRILHHNIDKGFEFIMGRRRIFQDINFIVP